MLAGALPCKQLIMGTRVPDGPSVLMTLLLVSLHNTTAERRGRQNARMFVCEKRDRAILCIVAKAGGEPSCYIVILT